jgi:integrase
VFKFSRKRAGIKDFTLHDLRHTAITRWAVAGMPQEIAMKASGHSSLAMHYRYVNVNEQAVKAAFKSLTNSIRIKNENQAEPEEAAK